MWQRIAVLVALALAAGPAASGSIIVQDQGFVIGTANGISLLHSNENGSSSQTLILSLTQDGTGVGSMLGSAHVLSMTSSFGGISGISALTGINGGLIGGGLSPLLTANSLSDQARLHMLMLSAY